MEEMISVDLEYKSIPATIAGKRYAIREMNGMQRDKYLSSNLKRMRVNDAGENVGIKNCTDIQSELLSLSLYPVDEETGDMESKAVRIETIRTWPATSIDVLFKASQKLNNLQDEKKALEKNDQEESG